jgi:hypothetical protein
VSGGGSLIHISNSQYGNGTSCYDLLSLTSSGALVAQLMINTAAVNPTQGPVVPANTWTHVVVIYGPTNGMRIYINGQLNSVSPISAMTTNPYNSPLFITLGNNSPLGPSALLNCRNGSIPVTPGAYTGAIDDFRLYSRELNSEEICVLANI